MNLPAFAWALGAIAFIGGCAPHGGAKPVDTAKIVDAIKIAEVRANADWKSGDASRVAAFFAPDATIMVAGAPPAVGAAAIKAVAQQLMDDPAFTLSFASDRVYVAASGDLAAARGSYRQTATDPATRAVVTQTGSYVTVFRPAAGGAWKGVWDIVAPGAPAPVTAPTPATEK
ncbi:MAG: YybH family protein [Caulobacteraceae bacterium]